MKFLTTALLILLPFFHTCLLAQQIPLTTDRPDQTESPNIVLPRHIQVEHGFHWDKVAGGSRIFTHPSTLIRYGVNERYEIRLAFEPVSIVSDASRVSGIEPLELGLKTKLLEEEGLLPDLAFLFHLGLSGLASERFRNDYWATSFRLNAQHTISENSVLAYNLGMEWDGASPEPRFIYTLTSGNSITDKWSAFVEIFAVIHKNPVMLSIAYREDSHGC